MDTGCIDERAEQAAVDGKPINYGKKPDLQAGLDGSKAFEHLPHEKFCTAVSNGDTLTVAYLKHVSQDGKRDNVGGSAAHLVKRRDITARINWLKAVAENGGLAPLAKAPGLNTLAGMIDRCEREMDNPENPASVRHQYAVDVARLRGWTKGPDDESGDKPVDPVKLMKYLRDCQGSGRNPVTRALEVHGMSASTCPTCGSELDPEPAQDSGQASNRDSAPLAPMTVHSRVIATPS